MNNVDTKYLAGIKQTRDRFGVVDGAAADDVSFIMDARCIFRKKSLVRRKDSSAKQSPLSTVSMSRQDQIKV